MSPQSCKHASQPNDPSTASRRSIRSSWRCQQLQSCQGPCWTAQTKAKDWHACWLWSPIRQLDHLGCLLLTVQVVVDFQAVHHRSKHIDPIFGNTVTRLGVPDKCSHAKKTRPMTKGNRSFKGGAVRPQTSNTATAFHQESSRERPSAAPS